MTTATAESSAAVQGKASLPGLAGWVLFDWATQPFYTLVTTFLFAPYFTAYFVGDDSGATWWAYTMGAAAIIVAIGSPLLGATADARGRLKPYIGLFSIAFVISQALLWFAEPGAVDRMWIIIPALIVATCCAEFATVLNNALMPRLVPPDQLGRISGTGWAVGYVGGVAALALLVAFVLADPGKPTIFGLDPLIANTPAREADRIVGPFCALWFAIFVLPFFLFTPDAPPSATGARIGVREAFRALGETLRNVRAYRDITLFLIAHLLFIDGLLAIFSFGGIYATTIFGWQGPQLAIFGIMLAIAGGLGAFGGGFLDDRLGSKTVIIGALILLIVACLGAISIDKTHVLFAFDVGAPEDNRAYFDSVGEAFYLFFGLLIGISAGPLQAASRSFLARLAPPEQMTEFFGLFAFSGKVSAFAAPLTIGLVNQLTGSLRLGMASILIYLAVGLAVMFAIGRQKPSQSA